MATSKANSVAPLDPLERPALTGSWEAAEQPRDFHFAVTWVTLFGHLNLIESTGPRPSVESPAATLALVPVVASPVLIQQPAAREDASTTWEMVVPKMIRTDSGSFAPVESSEKAS